MGKREFITGGVVVLSMAVGFGGMLAARLRNAAHQNTQTADEKGVKDALAAFNRENPNSFPAKSSLMEFREAPTSATPSTSASPVSIASSPEPSTGLSAAPTNTPPATPAATTTSAPNSTSPANPPNWAAASPAVDRYGNATTTDSAPPPFSQGLAAAPTTAPPATAPSTSPPVVADNAASTPPASTQPVTAPVASDPFRNSPGVATLGLPTDAPPSTTDPTASSVPPASTPNPPPSTAATAWPPTVDTGAGIVNNASPASSAPPMDPASTPAASPLQPVPVVPATAAAPADTDQRYGNDYRRRDYMTSDATTAIPPAATPGSADSQAQYQYVSPASPVSAPPPSTQRNQFDAYGREYNREPDPTNSDTPTQPPAGRSTYNSVPNAPVVPREGGPETYTLGPNDNYWTVSEKVYGTGAFFKAIEEHNRERYPYSNQLRVGDVISTPPTKVLLEKYPDLCPKPRQAPAAASTAQQVSMRGQPGARVYTVQKGDTLFDIARDELGKASRWAEIYELNRDLIGNDVDMLAPGMELRMPGGRDGDGGPLTTQSRQPFNR